MEHYCFENMLLREESASVEYPVKAAYNKPLTRNYNYVYKSRLFGKETDLSEGAPVLKLSIANGETYHGNATKEFKPAQPFRFMGVKG